MGSTPSLMSASRGAAVLGESKYKSPLEVYLEIQEERNPGFCTAHGYMTPVRVDPWIEPLNPKHAALRWGLGFENAICDLVGNVTDREKFYQHPKHDFITCHIDGLKPGFTTKGAFNVSGKSTIRLQENKTAFDMAFKKNWGEPGTDLIPLDYAIQTHHQSMCSGITGIDVNVLVFPKAPAEWEKMGYRIITNCKNEQFLLNDNLNPCTIELIDFAKNLQSLGYFHKYHIEANPITQKNMLDRYLAFWNDNILKEIEPPLNGYDDIKWLIDSPEGEIEADEEMKGLWSEYCDIKKEAEDGAERIDEIKNSFTGWTQRKMSEIKKITQVCDECGGSGFVYCDDDPEGDAEKPCPTCNGTKIDESKPIGEKDKLRIMAGSRNIFTIAKPKPSIKISSSSMTTLKDDAPQLYETMKKTSFLDIMPEELELTEKQLEKLSGIEAEIAEFLTNQEFPINLDEKDSKFYGKLSEKRDKFLKSLKLTKLLSKDSIIKTLQNTKPEIFNEMYERSLINETTATSRLKVNRPKED